VVPVRKSSRGRGHWAALRANLAPDWTSCGQTIGPETPGAEVDCKVCVRAVRCLVCGDRGTYRVGWSNANVQWLYTCDDHRQPTEEPAP
jgi:hypothetical protein